MIDDFIVNEFKDKEMEIMKKVSKKLSEALEILVTEGREKAMSVFN